MWDFGGGGGWGGWAGLACCFWGFDGDWVCGWGWGFEGDYGAFVVIFVKNIVILLYVQRLRKADTIEFTSKLSLTLTIIYNFTTYIPIRINNPKDKN